MKEFNIQPNSTYFIDTNIWLYAFIQSQNKEKTKIASAIIKKCDVVISTQIVNELCVNLIKKANDNKSIPIASMQNRTIESALINLTQKYSVVTVTGPRQGHGL